MCKFIGTVNVIFVKDIEQIITKHTYKEKEAKFEHHTTIDVVFLSADGQARLLEDSKNVGCDYEDVTNPIEILGGELGI